LEIVYKSGFNYICIKEKAPGRTYSGLSTYKEGVYKKDGERRFVKACGDSARKGQWF